MAGPEQLSYEASPSEEFGRTDALRAYTFLICSHPEKYMDMPIEDIAEQAVDRAKVVYEADDIDFDEAFYGLVDELRIQSGIEAE